VLPLDVIVFGSFEDDTALINDFLPVPAVSFELIGELPAGVDFDPVFESSFNENPVGRFRVTDFNLLFGNPGSIGTVLIRATFPGGGTVDYLVNIIII